MHTIAIRCSLVVGLLAGAALASSCQQPVDAAAQREPEHVIAAADIDRLKLGRTQAGEVEQIFGHPDRRDLDGSFIYFTKRRPSGEQDSVTFRFAGGSLAKICTHRAS
jgi:hypothetical protein